MAGHELAILLRDEAFKVKYSSAAVSEKRRKDIYNSLEKIIIDELQTLIAEEVHNKCHGCLIDHPSQMQHQLCLFMDRHDHTDMFVATAMHRINPNKIMEKGYPVIEEMALKDSEIVVAYKMWLNIKQNVINGFPDLWIEQWGEKVKQAWGK